MPIRWNPDRVLEALARIDEELNQIHSGALRLEQEVQNVRSMSHVPGYIYEPLGGISTRLNQALKQAHHATEQVRDSIPKTSVPQGANTQTGPTLF
jgi:hypothetical protein